MKNKLQYSIVYAVIRPEIAEQLSVGIICKDGDKAVFKYSRKKMELLKSIYTPKEYEFYSKVIYSMGRIPLESAEQIGYLTRYSNNMLAVSNWKIVDAPSSPQAVDQLYQKYVYQPN